VYGFTWREAVDRMARALNGFLIIGVKTTIPYFQQIVKEPDFIRMQLDTAYIDDHPQLMDYREQEREVEKLARLIAEINAYEKNPYTQ
jgi:pyruvate carboxylase